MNKTAIIILVIIATIVTLGVSLHYNSTKEIDWAETYNEKSSKPYGTLVFHKELNQLFEEQKIKTIYHTPNEFLYATSPSSYSDEVSEGNYMIIGNSNYLSRTDISELLDFVERGNTLFMSDYSFPEHLVDTLNIKIDHIEAKDEFYDLSFKFPELLPKSTCIDKVKNTYYFSQFEGDHYESLGYAQTNPELSNFLEIPHGTGHIYLHLEPKVFTNYNILKETRYEYVEGLLSYLPSANIYFDSYTKIYDNYYGEADQKSDLSWFLQQSSFKWAWYLALLLTFLFIIFNAKRRQRIIEIIKPHENTTVEFVKTISNLYYETQDHKNLIDKKINYFLENLRTRYNVDTSVLDDHFVNNLASRSGLKTQNIKKTIDFINWLRTKNEFFEDNLLRLNKLIEDFYSNK